MRPIIHLGRTWANIFLRLLHSSSIKTGTRRIMRVDELSKLVRRTKVDTSSRRIMRLVAVFIVDEFNRRRKNVCPSLSQTKNNSKLETWSGTNLGKHFFCVC